MGEISGEHMGVEDRGEGILKSIWDLFILILKMIKRKIFLLEGIILLRMPFRRVLLLGFIIKIEGNKYLTNKPTTPTLPPVQVQEPSCLEATTKPKEKVQPLKYLRVTSMATLLRKTHLNNRLKTQPKPPYLRSQHHNNKTTKP